MKTRPLLWTARAMLTPNRPDGTLTIKGHSVPLSLPFDLTLEADTATAQGSTQTDRRDFQIGTGMTDEGSLAFGVGISFDLTATRTAP